MTKQFWAFLLVGVAVITGAIIWTLAGTKGSHLRLTGEVLKLRTGAIDEASSAAVLDFRVENPSDVPFVVREATVTLEKPDGSAIVGERIAKGDLKQLLTYNRFLGQQYNDGLAIEDRIAPHAQVDRMIAVRFDQPVAVLDHALGYRLHIQDMDGPVWETEYKPPR